jgi:hypothetical protein
LHLPFEYPPVKLVHWGNFNTKAANFARIFADFLLIRIRYILFLDSLLLHFQFAMAQNPGYKTVSMVKG